jgi:hypothetical protein
VFHFLDLNHLLEDISDFCNIFSTNNDFYHYDFFLDSVNSAPSSSSKTFFSKERVGLDVFFTKGKKVTDFIKNTTTSIPPVSTVPTVPTIPSNHSSSSSSTTTITATTTTTRNNTPVAISPLLDNNLGILVPIPTCKYLLLKDVKTLLCGMKINKKVSLFLYPSVFENEVNKLLSELYQLVLKKQLSTHITEYNIINTFVHVFSFKKDI